ncbi:MAG: HesB/IscA family protein [Planctomycetota bacterium]|jgi:iron-sulfur cluster assembly protein
MAVTVTDVAAREIATIIRREELEPSQVCLRVGVRGGGCAGFNYILDLTEKQKETDEVWELTFQLEPAAATEGAAGDGADAPVAVASGGEPESITIRVICDPKSYLYLNGTTIDFRDEIMGRGFVFNNPNATSSCGCGSSFAV